MTAAPLTGLTLMPTGILKNEDLFNTAVIILESLLYRGVVSRSETNPPSGSPSPDNGTAYLVPEGSPTAVGEWSGQGGKIAVYFNGWRFIPPGEGLTVWVVDASQMVQYRSGVWEDINEFPAQTLTELDDVDLSGSPGVDDGDLLVYSRDLGAWTHRANAYVFAEVTLYQNATQSITPAVSDVTLRFDVVDGDTNAIPITPGTSMTVPSSLAGRRMRLAVQVDVSDGTAVNQIMRAYHNSTRVGENSVDSIYTQAGRQCVSRWFTVAEGDTIQATVLSEGVVTTNGNNTVWMTVEVH